MWALPPADDAANVQVAQVTPRRRMILAPGDTATVPVRITLQRFDRELRSLTVPVTVLLKRADGTVLTRMQREHRFAPGQRSTTLNLSMSASTGALDLDTVHRC